MLMSRFVFTAFNLFIGAISRIEYYYFSFTRNYYRPFMRDVFGLSYDGAKHEIKYESVKDGNVISVIDPVNDDVNIISDNSNTVLLPPSYSYDFVVYTNGYNSAILFNPNNIVVKGSANQRTLVPSKAEILFCDIEIDGKKLPIKFYIKEKYNFCVEGNKIDKRVIQYIVNKYYLEEALKTFEVDNVDLINAPFKIHIVDNLIRFVTLDGDDKFQFNKNDYVIFKSDGTRTVMNVD